MRSLRGQLVEVCGGRKITVGTVGRCVWSGMTRFGFCVRVVFQDGGTTSSTILSRRNVRPLDGQPVQQNLFGPS